MARVLVGLSGGVDSAVAAARLLAAGHQVEGMFMQLDGDAEAEGGAGGAAGAEGGDRMASGYTGEAVKDAQIVADYLGIKLHVWDLADEFRQIVKAPFVEGYHDGLTPNPCVRCNRLLKFGAVVQRALELGYDYVATGHYAQSWQPGAAGVIPVAGGAAGAVGRAGNREGGLGGWELRRGANPNKDQSYVLAGGKREMLEHAIFPLGDVVSKDDVRAEAAALGIPVAGKRDSFDICFIPDRDTRGYLRRHLGEEPGVIVDEAGEVVGQHSGAYQYTVGQRRGLHLPRPHADGQPRYVTGIEPRSGVIHVGPLLALEVPGVTCGPVNWIAGPEELGLSVRAGGAGAADAGGAGGAGGAGEAVLEGPEVSVQFRAHGAALPARIRFAGGAFGPLLKSVEKTAAHAAGDAGAVPGAAPGAVPENPSASAESIAAAALAEGNTMEVEFLGKAPRGVATGQSLVVYVGDRVVAQGNIVKTLKPQK